MDNNKDNLGEFLRKKFSEIEGKEEEWSTPSLEVRNNVLDQITEMPEKKKKRGVLFFLIFLGLVMSISFFEFWDGEKMKEELSLSREKNKMDVGILNTESVNKHLNSLTQKEIEDESKTIETNFSNSELIEQNTLLKTIVDHQNDIIKDLKEENLTTAKSITDSKSIQEASTIEAFKELLRANKNLKTEQEKLRVLNNTQQEKIKILSNENQLLLDRLNTQIYASNLAKEENLKEREKSAIVVQDIEPLIKKGLTTEEIFIEPVNLIEDFGLNNPKKKVQFELGYQLGFQGRIREVIEYTEQQGRLTNQLNNKLLVSHMHGLNVGISPIRNFWIRTGGHIGNMNLHQKHQVKLIYNSNSSTALTGLTDSDVHQLSNTGISTLERNIDALANAQGVVDGDNLDLNFETNLVLTALQIPLEFNYLYGKKRLQALFQLGGQWNLLNYQYYIHGFETKINNQNNVSLSVGEEAISSPGKTSVNYWGVHAGVGLNYNISKHFVLQGLFSYEYHFQYDLQSQPSSLQFSSAGGNYKARRAISNMRFGIKLGLNYRF